MSTSPAVRVPTDSTTLQLASVMLTGICALALPLYFIDLLPLSEFRDWLVFFQLPEVWSQNLHNLLARETTYSRNFSIMWAGVAESICRDQLRCVNAVASLPQALAVIFFFALLIALGVRASTAACFASLWALSVPMLATAAWQATILDRVGMCVTLAGLLHASRILQANKPSGAFASIVQLLACFAALNSKEAYWFYPIAVSLLCWVSPERDMRARLRQMLSLCAPMLLYSFWFAWRYWAANTFASGWSSHVSGGTMLGNLRALVDVGAGSWPALILVLMLALIIGAGALRSSQRNTLRYALWLMFVAALAYAPVSRTVAGSAYYFAPVLLFTFGAVAVLVEASFAAQTKRWAVLLVIALAATQFYAHSKETAALLWERRSQSAQFMTASLQATSIQPLRDAAKICLVTDPRDPAPHLWTQADSAYPIYRYVSAIDSDQWLRKVLLIHGGAVDTKATPTDCVIVVVPYPALPRNVYRWFYKPH